MEPATTGAAALQAPSRKRASSPTATTVAHEACSTRPWGRGAKGDGAQRGSSEIQYYEKEKQKKGILPTPPVARLPHANELAPPYPQEVATDTLLQRVDPVLYRVTRGGLAFCYHHRWRVRRLNRSQLLRALLDGGAQRSLPRALGIGLRNENAADEHSPTWCRMDMMGHRTHTQTTGPKNSSIKRHVSTLSRPSTAKSTRLDKRPQTSNPALHTAHQSAAQGTHLTMPARKTTARHAGQQRPRTPVVVPKNTNHHGHTP